MYVIAGDNIAVKISRRDEFVLLFGRQHSKENILQIVQKIPDTIIARFV